MEENLYHNLYHACRIAYSLGQEKVPWSYVCNAIRAGCGFESSMTFALKNQDFEYWPELKELIDLLSSCTGKNT